MRPAIDSVRAMRGFPALCAALASLLPPAGFGANKSAVEPQVLSLPKGPGSIEGLGESFEPQLNTGTATYRVKLAAPPGVNRQQPDLALVYNSGYGNSPLGLGWRLNVPSIQRQTDKGLPTYQQGGDTYIHSEAGELVPLADGSFRLKIEGSFMKFQRFGEGWEVWEKNGIHHYFGTSEAARLRTPLGTFEWRLEKSVDTHGNAILYAYDTDGGQLYLREIRYAVASDSVYQSVHFLYESRPDAFTDYRSRAKVLTARRLAVIEMRSQGALARKYRLSYQAGSNLSLLARVEQLGADGISALPPMTFGYSAYSPLPFATVAMADPPPLTVSLTNANADLIDIDGDALPDLLYTDPGAGHKFYPNQGRGRWLPEPILSAASPIHFLSTQGVMMSDMNGDGLADLYVKKSESTGYYRNRGLLAWRESDWTPFGVNPYFSFEDADTKLVDLNNDKLIDVLRSTDSRSYQVWLNPKSGPWNPDFDNETWLPGGNHLPLGGTITRLGDMNGDRLEDLVHVQDGYVSYFPGKGFGEFDAEVVMANPPEGLGSMATHLELADLDSDGLADLVLVGNEYVRVWLNAANGGFQPEILLQDTPTTAGIAGHRFADMDGDGFRDLLITNESTRDRYQYVTFNQGVHPNLLTRIGNGLGMETAIEYRASTVDYLSDRDAGAPWTRKLPFPVQVVARTVVKDTLSGQEYATDYHYRDGYYDGAEKEFRGFGEVRKHERGEPSAPGLVSRHVFDVGEVQESRKGMLKSLALLDESGSLSPLKGVFEIADHTLKTRTLLTGADGRKVSYSYTAASRTQVYERGKTPRTLLRKWDRDNYGNLIVESDYGLVEGEKLAAGGDEVLTTNRYRIDRKRWIVDRPSEVRKTNLAGGFVSWQKLHYDMNGDLIRDERSPDGVRFIPVVRNQHDAYGNIARVTDANGHSRRLVYDGVFHALPVRETIEGVNLVMKAAYDLGLGVMTAFTDPNGKSTTFRYDTFGRLAAIIKPGDSAAYPTQSFEYHLANPVSHILTRSREQSRKPGAYDSVSYFDGLGRKLQTRSEAEAGQWAVSEAASFNLRKGIQRQWPPYFDAGRDYAAPDLELPHTLFAFDARSRSVKETNPDGSYRATVYRPLEKVQYDEEDNQPDGPHRNTPHTSVFDGRSRLVEVRERNGADTYTTRYAYDSLDNLTRIVDQAGNTKTLSFDGLGRKIGMVDPDKGVMRYAYDDVGNLLETTDARNQTVAYAHDAANRALSESHQGVVKVRYHYDADRPADLPGLRNTLGRLAWVEDEAGRETYSYDPRGNIVAQTRTLDGQRFVTGLEYDALERLVGLTYPDQSRVEYRYNAMNRLEAIPGYVDNIDYMASGQKQGFEYANGVRSGYEYDSRQRLARLTSESSGGTLQDLAYGYDQASNITRIADQRAAKTPEDRTADYAYDDLYRLTEAAAPAWSEQYRYSPIGNMTFKSDLGAMSYGEGGAGPHALTTAGGTTYGYDANGNLASKPGYVYHFDPKDRLARVERAADGAVIDYAYDYRHQRKRKSIAVGGLVDTTLYVDRYSEVRRGRLIKNVYAGERLVARVFSNPAGDRTFFYLPDHLGSASLVTDASGAVVEESVFYPYGQDRARSGGFKSEYRFTGKELDGETGLHYFGARYYDSGTGRFMSVDPLISLSIPGSDVRNGMRALTQSTYSYAGANPARFTDSSGLFEEDIVKGLEFAERSFEHISNVLNTKVVPVSPKGLGGGDLLDRAYKATFVKGGYWRRAPSAVKASAAFERAAVTVGVAADVVEGNYIGASLTIAKEGFAKAGKSGAATLVSVVKGGYDEIKDRGYSLRDVGNAWANAGENISFGIKNTDALINAGVEGTTSVTAIAINAASGGALNFTGSNLQAGIENSVNSTFEFFGF